MKITFVSNSSFGEYVLSEVIESNLTPSLLIVSSDKKIGRGQKIQPLKIKDCAAENGIRVKEADDNSSLYEIIKEESPDLVIVAGFGLILSSEVLSLSKFINVHPSLLPKYRGATPIQSAILEGIDKSGVTIIEMNEKLDQGPIIGQKEVVFDERVDYPQAEEQLGKEGGKLLSEVILKIERNEISPIPQDDAQATYTRTLKKEDGRINWSESANHIERKIRAFNPWPGTYSKMGDNFFKVLEADIQEQTGDGPFGDPGKVYLGTNNTIAVQTGKDFLLIKKLQIEGKNSTTSKDFLQGNMSSMGVTLS